MLYHSPGPAGSQVCIGMCVLRWWPLPFGACAGCQSWKWQPPLWSEAGPGSKLALFPPRVCTLMGNIRLSLRGEQHQSTGPGAIAQRGLGVHGGGPSTQARVFLGGSKCVCILFKSRVLVTCSPSVSPQVFQPSERTHLPDVDPRTGIPNMSLKSLPPQGDPLICDIPLLFCAPCQGRGRQQIASPPLLLD